MTAAIENRNTPELNGLGSLPAELTVKNDAILLAGVMLAIDATPEALEASDTAALQVVGRCPEYIDNSADGETVNPEMGCFLYANDGSNPVVAGDKIAYVKDNQTVCAAAGSTNKVTAGLVIAVVAAGVWMCQTLEALRAAQVIHDAGSASAGAHIADVAAVTQDSLTLTSMTGAANTAPAAETNIDTLTGTLTGTLDNSLADCGSTSGGDVSAVINKNFKEVQAELVTQKALNTVLINNCKSFATQLNAARADNAAQVTKINAILARLEDQGISLTA